MKRILLVENLHYEFEKCLGYCQDYINNHDLLRLIEEIGCLRGLVFALNSLGYDFTSEEFDLFSSFIELSINCFDSYDEFKKFLTFSYGLSEVGEK